MFVVCNSFLHEFKSHPGKTSEMDKSFRHTNNNNFFNHAKTQKEKLRSLGRFHGMDVISLKVKPDMTSP